MSLGPVAFVGRARERAELREGLERALAGQGAVWLVSGEPGIGKSRLVEEVAREPRGALVLWGRCWEAGGAPAYWPWIQVLRALVRQPDVRALAERADRAAVLAQLVPELSTDGARVAAAPLPPDQARFQLMDTIAGLLGDAAAEMPLLVVLDDLHAADASSLLLLDFLSRQIQASNLAVLGTFRDAEAGRAPSLARLAQTTRTIALGRFDRAEVAAFLEGTTGAAPAQELVARVLERTEGNPLFVAELARLVASDGDPGRALAVPSTLRATVRERLAPLSEPARTALELASIPGREARTELLARAYGRDAAALADALDEAAAAALVVPSGPGVYRFTHILVREVVHDELPTERREQLHLDLAEALRRTGGPEADRPWSEIAHHYYAAGARGLTPAIEASERAARRQLEQLAFDDAVASYQRAIEALGSLGPGGDTAPLRRAELLLGLGRAHLRGGDVEHGRRACRSVADTARAHGDFDLFARAALELGSVYRFGHVPTELIGLLEEALDRLEPVDSSLRARVMARLAAALQPAADPGGPIAVARDAIEMARRVGDENTLLATLRAGCSAMVDLVDPDDRIELEREHLELAERRGQRVDALRGHLRLAFACFELGDLAGASAGLAAVRRIADEVDHPAYLWQARAADAVEALWQGRLDDAASAIDDAEELGRAAGDANARACALHQRMELFALRGEHDALAELAAAFTGLYGPHPVSIALAEVGHAWCLLRAGRAAAISPAAIEIALLDRTAIMALAELCVATDDAALATRLAERLAAIGDQLSSAGVVGRVWYGPLARAGAMVSRVLGRPHETLAWLERARDRSSALGSPVMEALDRCALAEELTRRGEPRRAAEHIARAAALAEQHHLGGVAARLAALAPGARPAAAPAPSTARAFALAREGDVWRIDVDGATFRIKDLKGMHMLATLVEHGQRELHVLDLAGSPAGSDAGDAGVILDEQARAQYRARLTELTETLEDAEARHDLGRAEAARQELEFLQRELANAVGAGGRLRRAGTSVERARVNVQRRLREAIRRIAQHSPALGRHLERSIRTGTYCSYSPE